jgi:hypothetical protein
MKRTLAAVLALAMLFVLAVIPSASDFLGIEGEGDANGYVTPGITHYFPLYDGGYQMQSDILEFFKFKINFLQGEGYVDTCKIVELSDDCAYLMFKTKSSYAYRTPVTIEIELQALDKEDKDNTYSETVEFEVGYGDQIYVHDDYLEVDTLTPLVEFDEDVGTCEIVFGDAATFIVRISEDKTTFNLHYSTAVNEAIQSANPTANLTFLTFTTKPVFDYTGVLKIYAPGANYLYTFDGYNDLTGVSAARNGDYLGLSTRDLDYYVASDIPLKASSTQAASSGAAAASSSSQAAASSSSTATGTAKPNPATGAAA